MANLSNLKPPEKSNLASLHLETEYRSVKDDPVGCFYVPCLKQANHYCRAVGYFRSTVFLVVGGSIVDFARRGGKIDLICSPELDREDIDTIAIGYARRSERVVESLIEQFDALLADASTSRAARTLATLISTGNLELKIAVRADRKGLYHEKIGVFKDGSGNRVSFKGSANETWAGWHRDGNFESIEVFCSWRGGLEEKRVNSHEAHFDALWAETDPHVEVFSFPVRALEHLANAKYAGLDQVAQENPPLLTQRRTALPHQDAAKLAWHAQGCRGIFEHATGSGKTFTAILAIREHAARGLPTIVLVPSRLLLDQWADELRGEVPLAALLLAGGDNDKWRAPNRLRAMTDPDPSLGARIVLATMQTASLPDFISSVFAGEHLLLVADEVHQVGSTQNSQVLTIDAGRRLGLSATPTRYGDPDGTAKIFRYFGDVVPPPITLADAIVAGRLVSYEYYPHPINLSATEAVEWKELTASIRLEAGRQKIDENGGRPVSEKMKMLLIKRARIAKKAAVKVQLALNVVQENYQPGQSWLVYCEDAGQLAAVMDILTVNGITPIEYHSGMSGDRQAAMVWFRSFGGVLVSIRCLDEGVDIPAVSHALILASSQNPRQFIQRRGRVLRRAPGKSLAVIHDAVVIPVSAEDDPEQLGLLRSELLRSVEFAQNAINRDSAAELRSIASCMGIDPDCLADNGDEDE